MKRYPRLPAVVTLLSVLALGAAFIWKSAATAKAETPLGQLERAIASGHPTSATWRAYADALLAARHFDLAAAAYHKLLDLEPFDRPGRLGYGLALAGGNAETALVGFLTELSTQDPKLALDLLDRPPVHECLTAGEFGRLYQESKAQAAD